ncbi:glycosyltransferase [Bacillus cereus group sp. N6]|uniref:tetratricopeptide repeat-containing glycosyltransferase family 2 protein n=1 Tax=Bacillus cereus group sp. N6 TaxID=2794583 RepID=UPI001F5B8FC0|nr:glycosyltransferase [Bacillus cereus group sp. N6]
MITISLCMIVKNEEHTLPHCLQSIGDLVDEIIIVDTGSTDQTIQIAKKWTSHVYEIPWAFHFSQARNASFQYASKDYIMWLDADDILQPSAQKKLQQLKQSLDPTIEAVSMKYNIQTKVGIEQTQRIRLVKREAGFQWEGIVHEDLQRKEPYTHFPSDIVITHTKTTQTSPQRNIELYQRAIEQEHIFSLQDHFHYARENLFQKDYRIAEQHFHMCLAFEELSQESRMTVYHQLATCYGLTNQIEKEQEITLQALSLDMPYPPFSCRMGEHFLRQGNIEAAIFWYTTAYQQKPSLRYAWMLNQTAFYTWVPHQQLAHCYEQLGDHKKAKRHQQKAKQFQQK